MRVHARRVGVTAPHGPLLEPTSLQVGRGEALLVAGDPGAGQTALGLVLSGRMRPSTGEVSPAAEPEASLPPAAVVGEEPAVNGARSGRRAVADWLGDRGADEYLDRRFAQVPAATRCALTLAPAAGRPGAAVLVLDSPDRYHGDPDGWWELARAGEARPFGRRPVLHHVRGRPGRSGGTDRRCRGVGVSAVRMAVNEQRRVTSGTLPKLAVVALTLVPLLYAALYLYANEDPYAHLDQVPAALVVEDRGATARTWTRAVTSPRSWRPATGSTGTG